MEVANSGAAPRRAEKPSPGKATVEREHGRPLTEMSPAPSPIWIDAEPLSRNVVGEAVGEFVTGVFIVAILCPVIWAFCLLIRYLGARWEL